MSAPRPVTVVTGGSRGIGAATVLRLARDGDDVVVGYRADASAAARVVAAARAEGVRGLAVRADVTDAGDVDALFDAAATALGPAAGVVANAGLTAHRGDLADIPVDVVLGIALCARRAAQVMSRRRGGPGGSIVTVSSSAATLGSAHEYLH
jgi:NAD(P)-dependent dehydrogenase (short-subunit alcohol dehydrogenase family)